MGLALASVAVSIVAAITALAMMNDLRKLPGSKRKAVIVMSAFVMGGGIWSMHFLAMLALRFDVPIHYDLLQTLSSGLIAILVVGFALLLLHFRTRNETTLNTAGLALGVGIVAMHFVGMLGMRGVIPEFSGLAIAAALVVALVTGVAAVRVSYGARSRQNIVKGGIMFGLSIVIVHHTAMLGTHFTVDPDYNELTLALEQGTLAIAVTVAAFVICGSFLLAASTFVPTAAVDAAQAADAEPAIDAEKSQASEARTPAADSVQVAAAAHAHAPTPDPAPASESGSTADAEPDEIDDQERQWAGSQPVKIPYEEHKQISFVPSDEVATIRADGRYTQLYTRNGVKFCPWSITEAEKKLSDARFYRSHRSYLINIQAITGFEKNRDAGICRCDGYAQLGAVPVSRARVGDLLQELGL